jgi:hypothetical protein
MHSAFTLATPRKPRLLLALLVAIFTLVMVAHAGHDHRHSEQKQHIAQVCDFCAALGIFISPQRHDLSLLATAPIDEKPEQYRVLRAAFVIRATDQARAPPR